MFIQLQVEVVEDDDLPTGVDRVLVERSCGEPLLLVARSAAGTLRLLGMRERRLMAAV